MSDKTIRFIDSDYRELFKIPDSGSIKIAYPPGDGRGTITRQCEHLNETHTRIGGNVYHICEFAEAMERLGARYEPEAQLRSAELSPFTAGDERFYTYNREEGNSCIGHSAGDFGGDWTRFHSGWYNHKTRAEADWSDSAPGFQGELYGAVYALRQDILNDYDSMRSYCESHPEALIDSGDGFKRYGFKLETDTRQYYTQCFVADHMRDSRFIIYAYDKAAHTLEQAQPAVAGIQPGTADESTMLYRNDEASNLCVGYLRGDFGKQGNDFYHNWFENDSARKTPAFQAEFQTVMDTLRQDVLKDYKSSAAYCYKHPEAKLSAGGDRHHYGFKLDTESRQYFVRCTTLRDDYFYVFAYDKAAARENERQDKPSVLDQIREARDAATQPAKDAPLEHKSKGGPEL